MDMHTECRSFCLNPLHPGPCKGSGKKKPAAGGGRPRKAGGRKAGGAGGVEHEQRAAVAAKLAGDLGMTNDPGKFGKDLTNRLAAARKEGDARYREVFTETAMQLGRGFINKHAPKGATPQERRRMAGDAAIAVAEAMNTGNTAALDKLAMQWKTGGRRSTTAAAAKRGPKTWSGMLAPIGKPTGDGRMFAEKSLTNRDLPLPLRFQRQDGGGHGGAVVVGRILEIQYKDDQAWARGDWLDPEITPEVAEAQEWSRQKVVGPSVDLDDAVMELVPVDQPAAAAAAVDADDCGCDDAHAIKDVAEQPMIKLVTQGRISGATLVQIPAFAECAALELSDEDGEVLTAAGQSWVAADPVRILGEDDAADDTGFYVSMSEDGQWVTVVRDNGDVDTVHWTRIDEADEADAALWAEALTASAATRDRPPAGWFANPQLADATPLTITDDGRIYGHLAKWGTCHVGLPGCVTAPRSHTSYAFFHTGEVITDDGRSLEVGKITLGTGHAHPDAGFRAAADHYDNSGAAVAVVRAGEDAHGIWVAGVLTDPDRVAELRRSPLSGDWRRIGNGMELVAALAVNVPGFPVPRSRVASGVPMSLVASGVIGKKRRKTEDDEDDPVDEDRMMDVAEKAVRKVNKRRRTYQAAVDVFDEIEQERADERVQTASLLLELI